MKLKLKRRKPITGEGGASPDLNIIITPMLDMAFQLLAFFIMTYHPPALEAVVDDTLLPAAPQKGKGPSKAIDPKDKEKDKPKKEPETKLSLQLIVFAVPAKPGKGEVLAPGQPKQILLFKPGQLEPSKVFTIKLRGATVNDPPADWQAVLDSLKKELEKSRASPAEKDLPLDISADRALKYQYVAGLRDVVGPLGFKRIGFNEPP